MTCNSPFLVEKPNHILMFGQLFTLHIKKLIPMYFSTY